LWKVQVEKEDVGLPLLQVEAIVLGEYVDSSDTDTESDSDSSSGSGSDGDGGDGDGGEENAGCVPTKAGGGAKRANAATHAAARAELEELLSGKSSVQTPDGAQAKESGAAAAAAKRRDVSGITRGLGGEEPSAPILHTRMPAPAREGGARPLIEVIGETLTPEEDEEPKIVEVEEDMDAAEEAAVAEEGQGKATAAGAGQQRKPLIEVIGETPVADAAESFDDDSGRSP
jgi:hypothetical protein